MDYDHLDPNFAHLLSSNECPLPEEAANIQEHIERSTRIVDKLLLQVHRLRAQRRAYRAVLSPMRRIPLEILGTIIGFLIEGAGNAVQAQRELGHICLVCRSWRDAALLSRRLWSQLEITISDDDDVNQTRSKTASLWLNRAGRAPTTLVVRGQHSRSCRGRMDCSLSNAALVELLTEGPSIAHLSIFCLHSICFQYLLEAIRSHEGYNTSPWLSLPSLKLSPLTPHDEGYGNWSEILFLHLPPITSLDLELPDRETRVHIGRYAPNIAIPQELLSGLLMFRLKCSWRGPTISSVLHACTRVEELALDFGGQSVYIGRPISFPAQQQIPLLPSLRTLRLQDVTPDNFEIISSIARHSLEELDISLAPSSPQSRPRGTDRNTRIHLPRPFFDMLLSRQGGRLRRLRIHAAGIHDSLLSLRNLEEFQALTHLTLDDTSLSFNVKRCGRREGDHPVLLSLQVLEILQLPAEFASESIIAFLENRRKCNELHSPGWADSLRRVVVTYQKPHGESMGADTDSVPVIWKDARTWGVAVDIGVGQS